MRKFFSSLILCICLLNNQFLAEVSSEVKNEPLTVVVVSNNPPFSFQLPDGSVTGLYVEFWQLWSKTTGVPIKVIIAPFEDGLKLMKNQNTLHAGMFSNDERRKWGDFTQAIHKVNSGVLYSKKHSKMTKLRELNGLPVATQSSSYHEFYLRKQHPELNLKLYDGLENGIKMLLNNQIEAVVSEFPKIRTELAKQGLSGVFAISDEVLFSNYVYGVIAKGQLALLEKINIGIESIPLNKLTALEKKWLPTLKPFFKKDTLLSTLTLAERKWLQKNPILHRGVDSAWYPYEYLDDKGNTSGLATDYIDYINRVLSINIKAEQQYNWAESVIKLKNHNIDLVSAIVKTPDRENLMLFTEPYFSTPTVLVSRKSNFNANSLERLSGRTLGVVSDVAVLEFIKKDYPDILIIPVDSIQDGLLKLNKGNFDAFIGDISVINFAINKLQLSDLIITGFSPYRLDVSMAISPDLKPLVEIINKVFSSMSDKEKAAIANNWLAIQVKSGTDLSTIFIWVVPIFSLLLLIIFSFVKINKRLQVEIDNRMQSEKEQKLLEAQLHQSQKMEALGKLTGGIAHDFNNMLGVILGYAELLKTTSLNHELFASYVDHISHAGERGAKLTKKLMSFTRKNHLESVRIDINKLLTNQQDMLEKTLTVRIKLTLALSENIWPIWLDSSDLEDALLNMSINAMHALDGNQLSPELIIKTNNITLSKRTVGEMGIESGDYVELNLIDNGCGMTEETQRKIFDPFYSTKGEQGTGLGLSQVFGFMQRSCGHITVNSSLDIGTQFTLYFPRYTTNSDKKLTDIETDAEQLSGSERILIVDDELALSNLASQILQNEDYSVLIAQSAQAALNILDETEVDLVLTDVIMPEMDGYQLSAKIKEIFPHISILLVSGYANENNRSVIDDRLDLKLIHKPYKRLELLQAVKNILSYKNLNS